MSDFDKIKQLEAMVIHLTKRVEKLEGRSRMAPPSTYFRELSDKANELLKYWN